MNIQIPQMTLTQNLLITLLMTEAQSKTYITKKNKPFKNGPLSAE